MKKKKLPTHLNARWALALACVLPLALWLRTTSFEFLSWDDADTLLTNARYRGFSWTSLHWMWTTHYMGPYQPISWMTYALNYTLGGLDPRGYHLLNNLLHVATAGVLFDVLYRLLKKSSDTVHESWIIPAALLGSLFYSLHPLRTESVAWVTERRDVLSGLFLALCVRFHVSDAPSTRLWALLWFALGGLSKATALGGFWIIAALEGWNRRGTDLKKMWKPLARTLAPYVAIGLVIGILNLYGLHSGAIPATDNSLLERIIIFLHAPSFYLFKTILPISLSPYYILSREFVLQIWIWAFYGAATLAITAIAIALRRSQPLVLVSWILFILILLPVSGLLQNGQQRAADRYTYLAALPYSLLVASLWVQLMARLKKRPAQIIAGVGAVCLLSGLAIGSWRYQETWRASLRIWQTAVQRDPQSYLANFNLATEYMKTRQLPEARAAYVQTLTLDSREAAPWVNLGQIQESQGRWKSARVFYELALRKQASHRPASAMWCLSWLKEGKPERAAAELKKLLDRDPEFNEARFNYAVILLVTGNIPEARAQMKRTLDVVPALGRRLTPAMRQRLGMDYRTPAG